jgi:hypothetical protein
MFANSVAVAVQADKLTRSRDLDSGPKKPNETDATDREASG